MTVRPVDRVTERGHSKWITGPGHGRVALCPINPHGFNRLRDDVRPVESLHVNVVGQGNRLSARLAVENATIETVHVHSDDLCAAIGSLGEEEHSEKKL